MQTAPSPLEIIQGLFRGEDRRLGASGQPLLLSGQADEGENPRSAEPSSFLGGCSQSKETEPPGWSPWVCKEGWGGGWCHLLEPPESD